MEETEVGNMNECLSSFPMKEEGGGGGSPLFGIEVFCFGFTFVPNGYVRYLFPPETVRPLADTIFIDNLGNLA